MHKVEWAGGMYARRIHKYDAQNEAVPNGGVVQFRPSEFGIPGNIGFHVQVYAPGVTDTWWDKQAAIDALDLHVESGLIRDGEADVRYAGQAGINGHDFDVQVRLSEMVLGGSNGPGVYPVRFMSGEKTLASFTLEYVEPNDRGTT